MNLSSMIIPAIIAGTALFAIFKKVDVYSVLVKGAGEGLRVTMKMLPALVGLLSAVYMLRASGALDALTNALMPVFELIGIPAETTPLIFIRPMSGSGALAVGSEIISEFGADSQIGRTAAVMLGATETTFYTVAVYFGAARVKKSRYAIPAALCADLTGFIVAALTVRLMFS